MTTLSDVDQSSMSSFMLMSFVLHSSAKLARDFYSLSRRALGTQLFAASELDRFIQSTEILADIELGDLYFP
jgi:hypothetical protein